MSKSREEEERATKIAFCFRGIRVILDCLQTAGDRSVVITALGSRLNIDL